MSDAVVVGAGPNGLVAANLLADAGWSVTVLEATERPGGAVASRTDLLDGTVVDLCSAFYPLVAASRAMGPLRLEDEGLVWCRAPDVLAHPTEDGRCPVLSTDPDRTAGALEALGPGDGDAWRRSWDRWQQIGGPLLDALFTPFPPLRSSARLVTRLGLRGGLELGRFALLPVRRLLEEEFAGDGGLLVAGCAMHADLAPESAGSGFYGWLLSMLGQEVGWPVPEGGAGRLAEALVRRLERRGGAVACGQRVTQVVVRRGRAVGVRTATGDDVPATRAVVADVAAPALYGGLVGWEHLPAGLPHDLARFHWDWGTFKVDWLVDGAVPWTAGAAGRAGTVHLGGSLDDMTVVCGQLARGVLPAEPFLLVGQMSVADPTRSPPGTSQLWAYTHVPRRVRGDAGPGGLTGAWDRAEVERMADRIEDRVERFAPGFRGRIRGRSVLAPADLEAHDANLVGGGINGGTAGLHQQLVFRPSPGLGRSETPVAGLYLASASAHPGGGVHGACGANAARAALASHHAMGRVGSAVLRRLQRRAGGG